MEESPDIGLLGRGWLSPNGLRGLAGRGKLWAVGLTVVDGQMRIGCISFFLSIRVTRYKNRIRTREPN
jgi:hypothetical protein